MASSIMPSDDDAASVLNAKHDEDHYFPQFALLPWELRNQIWNTALQRRRLIRVDLSQPQRDDLTEQEKEEASYGPSSTLYVNGFRAMSKLLRVNSEARRAALKFYRVHLPCVLVSPEAQKTPKQFGTFYFNPEHDILLFGRMTAFPRFFSSLVRRDSRRVGLCSLAVHLDLASSTQGDVADASEYKEPGFVEAVRHIRELYLIAETSAYRQRYAENIYADLQQTADDPPHHPISHKLYPLMSNVPTFDVLPRDPRPVADDLARLPFGNAGELMHQIARRTAWARGWGLDVAGRRGAADDNDNDDNDDGGVVVNGADGAAVDARVLFVYRDENPCFPVEDGSFYEGADADRLRASGVSRTLYEPRLPAMPTIVVVPEKPLPGFPGRAPGAGVAVGFWLFPLDAFAEANRVDLRPSDANGYVDVWDLSRYWPALALAHIPVSSKRAAAV